MSGKKKSGSARAVPRAYGRLTRHERDTVQRMLERRASCREIARELGRSPSTVSAEVASHRFVTAPKARRGERVDASAAPGLRRRHEPVRRHLGAHRRGRPAQLPRDLPARRPALQHPLDRVPLVPREPSIGPRNRPCGATFLLSGHAISRGRPIRPSGYRVPTFIRTCADECGRCSDKVDNQGVFLWRLGLGLFDWLSFRRGRWPVLNIYFAPRGLFLFDSCKVCV